MLASFKDYDTTSDTFSMEAYNLLGESDQIGLFAAQGMENAANQFSVLANIKKEFGVEGFDPLTYGAEGFTDTVKKAWSWLVAAFKKLIQSVSNFIRGVMNFVGGIVAKTQSGLVDKYKNLKATDPSKGKTVKGMIPLKGLSQKLSSFNQGLGAGINMIQKGIDSLNATIASGGLEQKGAAKAMSSQIASSLKLPGTVGKDLDAIKPANVAKEAVFGKAVVTELKPTQLLADGEWKTVLSKDFLNKMKEFVSDGKKLIKMFQNCLKQIEAIQKQVVNVQNAELNAKKEGATKAQKQSINNQKKGVANQMKKTRSAISEITHYRNFSGKMTGILYGVYANCLKARSYYASAVRSYAAAKPAKGSKKAKEEAAFQKRTGVNA
ncbi:MAG: hypothetical protein IJ772_05510 [Bacilli bacterium]|nr:hypothetical protein [Bacilli bacterium]